MKKFFSAVAVLALLGFCQVAQAQLLQASATVPVTVNVSVSTVITVSETGGTLTFNPTTGVTNQVTFTTAYNIGPASNITLYSWFSNAASALSAGGSNIPSSAVSATFSSTNPGGGGGMSSGSGTPCNQSPGVGNGVVDGAACQSSLLANVSSLALNPTGNNTGSATTTYSLALLNYANNGLHLPAGNFSGTLNVLALAI